MLMVLIELARRFGQFETEQKQQSQSSPTTNETNGNYAGSTAASNSMGAYIKIIIEIDQN